jgi:hypothetical protein
MAPIIAAAAAPRCFPAIERFPFPAASKSGSVAVVNAAVLRSVAHADREQECRVPARNLGLRRRLTACPGRRAGQPRIRPIRFVFTTSALHPHWFEARQHINSWQCRRR